MAVKLCTNYSRTLVDTVNECVANMNKTVKTVRIFNVGSYIVTKV